MAFQLKTRRRRLSNHWKQPEPTCMQTGNVIQNLGRKLSNSNVMLNGKKKKKNTALVLTKKRGLKWGLL